MRKEVPKLSFTHLLQAEEVNINNKVYHKKCLTCGNCKRNLDISILAIGPDDDIYCKVCYLRYWGPGTRVYQAHSEQTTDVSRNRRIGRKDVQRGK